MTATSDPVRARLNEIHQREINAIPAPWFEASREGDDDHVWWLWWQVGDLPVPLARFEDRDGDDTTAEFIAHARSDVPALLAVVTAVLDITTDGDGNEFEHNKDCEGEPTCPACWVVDIRRAVSAALGVTDEGLREVLPHPSPSEPGVTE